MILQLIHEYPQQASVAFWTVLGTCCLCAIVLASAVEEWAKRSRPQKDKGEPDGH